MPNKFPLKMLNIKSTKRICIIKLYTCMNFFLIFIIIRMVLYKKQRYLSECKKMYNRISGGGEG